MHQTEQNKKETNPVIAILPARILLLHKVPQVVIIVEIEEQHKLLRMTRYSVYSVYTQRSTHRDVKYEAATSQ